MNLISTKTFLLIAALATLSTLLDGCATPVRPTVDPGPPPPTPDQLVGTWITLSPWWGNRLELLDDHTGTLETTYVVENGAIRRYRTEHWDLTGDELSATFVPVDSSNRYSLYLRGKANAVALVNVMIGLADSTPVAGGHVFARERRVRELLDLLSPTTTRREPSQAAPNESSGSTDLYTDEQISRMTLIEAQDAISKVAHQRVAEADSDRAQRLKRQFELLLRRIRDLNEQKDSGN